MIRLVQTAPFDEGCVIRGRRILSESHAISRLPAAFFRSATNAFRAPFQPRQDRPQETPTH